MKKHSLLLLVIPLLIQCAKEIKQDVLPDQVYGNSTENTKISPDKIDGSKTYEIGFTLEKPADCIIIDVTAVYLHKTFPVEKEPEKTYFIVEKKLKITGLKLKESQSYTPIGRNFNNDWELYSPVKICSIKNDPLSVLDLSEYRIRFTAFENRVLYYIITINCESKIFFDGKTVPFD